MKRRDFFKLTMGASLLSSLPLRVWAQGMMGRHGSMSETMPGHNMMAGQGLMTLKKMPAGQALQTLPVLKNSSQQKGQFQGKITASTHQRVLADGKSTELWLYNGQAPGPLIELYEGDQVEIEFKNQLDQATTIHWHGLPVPSDQDGNPHDPVLPGQSRYYRFTLPEGCAGTYWYHPHPHGKSGEQVAHGLGGTIIVRSPQDPLKQYTEQHWAISDLRLDINGRIPANTGPDWMNGREGQFVLLNGQREPHIQTSTGERIRVWNSCSARYLNLHIPGARLLQVGTDGGLLEQVRPAVTSILLAPAERVEFFIQADKDLSTTLQALYYDRQKMMVQDSPETLTLAALKIRHQDIDLPEQLRAIPAIPAGSSTAKVVFSEVMPISHDMPMPSAQGASSTDSSSMSQHDMGAMNDGQTMPGMAAMRTMFRINNKVYDMDRIDLRCPTGEWQYWDVINDSHMDHPFHLHGTQFQVLARQTGMRSQPEPFRAWRDTVNLRPNETVRLAFRQELPGLRMFHCHILEHEDLGMMAQLMVE
ncbi:oxidoreductase [Alcaligenes pakistanensis]|uniref:Oxidoreductase n=1 Tax=Alcaligenes pakistanensis TaxID=1482717 RepID=A0A8H9IKG1_9BURK|nr:multicopper oxidase family protein [Alcaligenes pakistanensis]GHC35868.1 oxidoreductase [Alcaligenes pakistanensis]